MAAGPIEARHAGPLQFGGGQVGAREIDARQLHSGQVGLHAALTERLHPLEMVAESLLHRFFQLIHGAG